MSIFTGSGVATITPFKTDGSIDFEAFEKLIEFQIQNRTDALIVCGTTGEASTLTDDEQIEAITFAVRQTKKRIPVIAGAGSNDTSHGVSLSKRAEKAGADGLLLVTPYYNKTSQKGLIEHYETHAKNVDIPIILYNVPSRTGLNIKAETAGQLSKIENIVGIKEASGDIVQVAEVARHTEGRMDIYSGNDDHIVPVLSLGGIGVISTVANIIPAEVHNIVADYLNGELKKSLDMQLRILPLVQAVFSEVNPIPIKTAVKHMGKISDGWHYRKPLTYMTEENEQKLIKQMKFFGLI